MTLHIIAASVKGMVVASDRRTATNVTDVNIKVHHKGSIYFDGAKKSYFFPPPHNFIVLTQSGRGMIKLKQLAEDLVNILPNNRLDVEDYVKTMISLYSTQPSNYKDENIKIGQESYTFCTLSGYNPKDDKPDFFHFKFPDCIKANIIQSKVGLYADGVDEYLPMAFESYKREFQKSVEKKVYSKSILGIPATFLEATQLEILNKGEAPVASMEIRQLVELTKYLIEFTASEQIRLKKRLDVGSEMDILAITAKKGVVPIQSEKHLEIEERKLVKTNQHHILIECCKNETIYQIDFEAGNILNEGYFRYPSNDTFVCPLCNIKQDLLQFRKSIEERIKKDFVISIN